MHATDYCLFMSNGRRNHTTTECILLPSMLTLLRLCVNANEHNNDPCRSFTDRMYIRTYTVLSLQPSRRESSLTDAAAPHQELNDRQSPMCARGLCRVHLYNMQRRRSKLAIHAGYTAYEARPVDGICFADSFSRE
jgi:hypothetical protein